MLRTPDDVDPGQIVYLYPHTKMAGRWCWMKKQAVVEDAKTRWPLVHVTLTHEGVDYDAYPHKDDINIRPDAKSKQGDMGNAGVKVELGSSRRTALRAESRYEIALADGEEQGTLF